MSMLIGIERGYFHRCIVAAKLNVDDFEITLERDTPGSKRKGSLGHTATGTLKVTYKPTGVSTHYRYGLVPPAYLEFEADLNANIFKTL